MQRSLKWVRVVLALLVFITITISFTYFGAGMPNWLLKTQFIPAFISIFTGGLLAFVLLLLLTLLFGRVYCSVLCPMGVFQDIVRRGANLFKSRKKRRTKFTKERRNLRFVICVIVFLPLLFGITTTLVYTDPYSNWGRISSQIIGGFIQWVNNLLSGIFPETIFYRPFVNMALGSFIFTICVFFIVLIMSALKGRLYCNTICPVGTLLGFMSKFSMFRVRIDKEKCIGCDICSKKCKSYCIDGKNKYIDDSRCVACFDCIGECKQGAISYRFAWKKREKISENAKELPRDSGRREAISIIGLFAATVAARGFSKEKVLAEGREIKGIVPPGGRGIMHLMENCTACYACIAACPNKIIKPATGEYKSAGIEGFMLPVISYKHHFCAYDCNECTKVCPNGALIPLPLEEKKLTQLGRVQFYPGRCIVRKDETSCGACDEHCPTKAITMRPLNNGLTFPSVNTDLCIGCGGCEYICPARPLAMIVQPNKVHGRAEPPKIEKQEKIEELDFGF